MNKINKYIIIGSSIAIIVVTVIFKIEISLIDIKFVTKNYIVALSILPFNIIGIMAIIFSLKDLFNTLNKCKNQKKFNQGVFGIKVSTEIIDIKKRKLLDSNDTASSPFYYYYIVCKYIDNNKVYKFKGNYLHNKPNANINSSIDVYLNKNNFKAYYVDDLSFQKKDQEIEISKNFKDKKYFVFKINYDLIKVKKVNNRLVAYDKIRKKKIYIEMNRINKIEALIINNEMKQIRLYTLFKQIEIKNNDENCFNEINEYFKNSKIKYKKYVI